MIYKKGFAKIVLIIALVVVVVLAGAAYLIAKRPASEVSQPTPAVGASPEPTLDQTAGGDFSRLDNDILLHKLFPNLSFKNGAADLTRAIDVYSGLKLYLKNFVEDYFANNQEKSLLLIAQLDGVAHAGGLYHSYLGLFDKNGNLLTPSSGFPISGDFFYDKAHFGGGDEGSFGFYDCKGIKYILFVSSGCPNGSCCDANANLFKINNGNFEVIQTVDSELLGDGPFRMILSPDDKILIKKVPPTSENDCPETNYKELKWNKNSCKFE